MTHIKVDCSRANLARGLLFDRNNPRSQHIDPCHLNPRSRGDWHKISSAQTQGQRWTDSHFPYQKRHLRCSTCTKLYAFGLHAEVTLAARGVLNVGQDVDVGLDAEGAQMTHVKSISLLGYISNCIQHSPFGFARSPVSQACPQRPTSVQSRSRNPVAPVFSPPQTRLLAGAALQKTVVTGSSTDVAAKRFRSVLADERSGIARGTVLEAKPNGEDHDCNRICNQAS